MGFKKFKRKDFIRRDDVPRVSIRRGSIAFGAALVERARLKRFSRVTVLVDGKGHKLGFKFHNDEGDPDSYKLYSDGPSNANRVMSAVKLVTGYGWLEAVSLLKLPRDRQFIANRSNANGLWVIRVG